MKQKNVLERLIEIEDFPKAEELLIEALSIAVEHKSKMKIFQRRLPGHLLLTAQ